MHPKTWYEFTSPYSASGINVRLNNESLELSQNDICYLLCLIDVLACHLDPPLETISFRINEITFNVRDIDWMYFADALLDKVFDGGWTRDCCEPTKKWLEELVENNQIGRDKYLYTPDAHLGRIRF